MKNKPNNTMTHPTRWIERIWPVGLSLAVVTGSPVFADDPPATPPAEPPAVAIPAQPSPGDAAAPVAVPKPPKAPKAVKAKAPKVSADYTFDNDDARGEA